MSTSPLESSSPEWLNKDYIKLILSKIESQGNPELDDFVISAGSAQGQNFAGVIIRVHIKYTLDGINKHVTVIIKASPTSGAVGELLEDLDVFGGELCVYKNVLSRFDELLPSFKIAPRLLYADDKAMVLEDLTKFDFVLANRKNHFDLKRAKLVLTKIAQFHALTATMYNKDQSSMERHMISVNDAEEMTPLSFFFSASLQESLETIRSCDDLQKFVPFLESFDIVQEEKNVYTRNDSDRFRVLNHGDLWMNNIFFKFNDAKEPIDVLLVDYQESYFGSPGIDFNHFLYTSCNYEVHNNHIDELIVFYYDNLVATLKLLKYEKIPSLDDIKYEIKNKAKQGLIVLLTAVPVQMIENPEHANPEYFLAYTEEAQVIRRIVYGNPHFVETLKFFLPKLSADGVLGHLD